MTDIIDIAEWQGAALGEAATDWLLVLFVRGPKRIDDIHLPAAGRAELQRRRLADVLDGWVFLTSAGTRVALGTGMGANKAAIAKQERSNDEGAVALHHALSFMLDTHGGSVDVPENYPFGPVCWKRGGDGTTSFRIDDMCDHGSAA